MKLIERIRSIVDARFAVLLKSAATRESVEFVTRVRNVIAPQRVPVRVRRFALLTGVSMTLLSASSCTLPSHFGQAEFNKSLSTPGTASEMHADYQVESVDDAKPQSPSGIQQLSHEVSVHPQSPELAQHQVREWPALPTGQVHPFASPVVQTQHSTIDDCPSPECYPADPRIALPMESLSLEDCRVPWDQGVEIPLPVSEPEIWADEYLCDGGDRGQPVHYHGVEMAGLETEDTVGEFYDEEGRRRVNPSTRACIYAPQFASVTSASLSQINRTVDRLAGHHDRQSTVGMKAKLALEVERQSDQPIGLNVRSRVSGLDTDMATNAIEQITVAINHVKLINLFEDRAFFSRSQLDQTQEAYLAFGLQAANEWTRDRNPVIAASNIGGEEVIARFQVEEYTGVEDKSTPGDLRIMKLADVHSAHPGDVVSFTIHFDNVGQRELTRVRIIDNLTPRLEFIEGSADSDREGRLDISDNGEGSLVLTFELAEPLPGETGGTVSFQCRVR